MAVYLEDYREKPNITLFSEDYLKFTNSTNWINSYFLGYFKKRFNGEYSLNLNSLLLAESVKRISLKIIL